MVVLLHINMTAEGCSDRRLPLEGILEAAVKSRQNEVIAVQDEELGVGGVAEAGGESLGAGGLGRERAAGEEGAAREDGREGERAHVGIEAEGAMVP